MRLTHDDTMILMMLIYVEAALIMVHNSEDSVNSGHEIQVPYSLSQAHTYITIETTHPQQQHTHKHTPLNTLSFFFFFFLSIFSCMCRDSTYLYTPQLTKTKKLT